MLRAKITIQGDVQGVSFRYYAQQEAQKLGLAGFVQNMPGGEVYAEVEGGRQAIEKFIAWCRQGSPWARVKKVKYQLSQDLVGFKDFKIKYN